MRFQPKAHQNQAVISEQYPKDSLLIQSMVGNQVEILTLQSLVETVMTFMATELR